MKKLLLALLFCPVAMAETVISPNMNLPVPVVNVTPGPAWANDINSCMSTIDSHDHTPGKGVPISSDALDINSDLSLNDNSLAQAKSVVFSSQSSFPTNQSMYVIAPDLFYNDGNGNVIQITQSGSVSGASGTITGLPSGTASAAYQSVGGTFQFQSATNTPANITGASVTISEQVASVTPAGITLKAPTGLAASYNVTFPASVPAFSSLLSMSTAGTISTVPSSAPAFQSLLSMNASGTVTTVPYKAPTAQKFTSGSGTYTLPTSPSPLYIRVRLVGGGGGGAGSSGSGADNAGSGGTGGTTTFGSSFLTATGGDGGSGGGPGAGGVGGTGTISAGTGITYTGQGGVGGFRQVDVSSAAMGGSAGGSSMLGGGARGGAAYDSASYAASANSGGGGSSSGIGNTASPATGGGGGGGGGIDIIIASPSSTYAYSVGAGGTPGSAGSGGGAGGAGGSGVILVEEFYQ